MASKSIKMASRSGKIVTFYSFKGGVGRTMALANVAFLAANNGMRVLVMDWDLEAPGLAYYFRGLLDPQQGRSLKDAPGLLNVLWEWTISATHQKPDELGKTLSRFRKGEPFKECAHNLMPQELLPDGAALDYISAGSRILNMPTALPYEEALANFSWPEFFERHAGGAILNGLREWCKKEYDLILIDSRTGLADVAGICTMQLPDEVILCFILNRQNIDGVARVSQAIRQKRNDKIMIRAIPMRTSREGTSEESDAKAKAISELVRVGGFSHEALNEDFKVAIRATEGVPFYETLATLLPQTPAIEVFSTNYRQLASQITGRTVQLPDFSTSFKELVRRRLQPRHATVEYVKDLHSAEPTRAVAELYRLLESAYQDEIDGGSLDDEYVRALTDAAFIFSDLIDLDPDAEGMAERALDLLRAFYAEDSEKWAASMLDGLERYWLNSSHALEPQQQLVILEEIDSLLSESNAINSKLQRIEYRRNAARIYYMIGEIDATTQTISEAWSLINSIKSEHHQLQLDHFESLTVHEAELIRSEADIKSREGDIDGAIEAYETGVSLLEKVSRDAPRGDALRSMFVFHVRLAQMFIGKNNDSAVKHALMAVELGGVTRIQLGGLFASLASPIIASKNPDYAVRFCAAALLQEQVRSSSSIATMAGRSPRQTMELVAVAASLAGLIAKTVDTRVLAILESLSNIVKLSLGNLSKRRSILDENQLVTIEENTNSLKLALADAGVADEENETWETLIQALHKRSPIFQRRRNPE